MSTPAVGQVDLEPRLFKMEAGGGCHLVGGKCSNCGTVTWGVRAMCPQCWQEATQSEVPIGQRGKLYSSTTVRHAPQGFSAPYLMGVIDLDEGLRVIARVLARQQPSADCRRTANLFCSLKNRTIVSYTANSTARMPTRRSRVLHLESY